LGFFPKYSIFLQQQACKPSSV